uniref:Uncharacterized protein n=1 Tax=Lepeophtheirus salmonis TaxID=72036 RepID=A0A0K2UP45_LEPSM
MTSYACKVRIKIGQYGKNLHFLGSGMVRTLKHTGCNLYLTANMIMSLNRFKIPLII